MKNRAISAIIFVILLVGLGFAGGLLYMKNAPKKAAPAAYQAAADNAQGAAAAPTPASQGSGQKPPSKPTCIITIDGRRYDVQSLRSTHSGGDVFQCGTDMSDIFHGQHGDNLRMIQKYLVN